MNLELIKFRKINLNFEQTIEDWLSSNYDSYADRITRFTFYDNTGEIIGETIGNKPINIGSANEGPYSFADFDEVDSTNGDENKFLTEAGNFKEIGILDLGLFNANGEENILINEKGNKVASPIALDLTTLPYMLHASRMYYKAKLIDEFEDAWADMKTVQTVEKDSYPNGETNGVIIPYGTTSIGSSSFENLNTIDKPLIIPNSVTSIGNSAFSGWNANTHPLVIPESVTSISSNAFKDWVLVPYVVIEAETPPTLGNLDTFGNQNNAPIYVPDASLSAYKAAAPWWAIIKARLKPLSELGGL